MNLVAFAASSSTKSINKKLVSYAANLLNDASVEVLDLNDYELPLFSEDKEAEIGKPDLAKLFLEKLGNSDAIIISFAEHNGSYTAAFKNLFDWCSRINPKVYQNKPVVLLSTSPGARGAATILSTAINSMSHFAGEVKGSFSLPSFYDNFDVETNEIRDEELASKLKQEVEKLYS
jgi:chromate reductase, NAD(P)H dehydrogenase (quinone)